MSAARPTGAVRRRCAVAALLLALAALDARAALGAQDAADPADALLEPGREDPTALGADEPPNQTEERERLGLVPTIAGDLRRPGAWSHPALGLPAGSGTLALAVERWTLAWPASSAQAQARAQAQAQARGGTPVPVPLPEARTDATLRWSQSLGTPALDFEAVVPGAAVVGSDRAGADAGGRSRTHLGDPGAWLVGTLAGSRFSGVALALGALAPVGGPASGDWLRDHGSIHHAGWTGASELRAAGGIGLLALQARLAVQETPHGENTVPGPGGTTRRIAHRFLALEAAVSATQRLTTGVRLGLEALAQRWWWHARGDQDGFTATRVRALPLALLAEVTPVAGTAVMVWAGGDAAHPRTLSARQRLLGGVTLLWAW